MTLRWREQQCTQCNCFWSETISSPPARPRSQLAQLDLPDGVVGGFVEHEIGPAPAGLNVHLEVREVDGVPDLRGQSHGLVIVELRVAEAVGVRVLEGTVHEGEEAGDIPLLDAAGASIDVDGEVEVVAERQAQGALVAGTGRLEEVEVFEDEDIGGADDHLGAG